MSPLSVKQPPKAPLFCDTELYQALDQAKIPYQVLKHQAVFSVQDSHKMHDELPEGLHIKNLFLKDRKKNFFLISLQDNLQIDLKILSKVLDARGGLSFARPEQLYEKLGVLPGAVTPYAIINAEPGDIQQYFDQNLYTSTFFHAHPLRNDRTLTAKTDSVIQWLNHLGYPIGQLDFSCTPPQIK